MDLETEKYRALLCVVGTVAGGLVKSVFRLAPWRSRDFGYLYL